MEIEDKAVPSHMVFLPNVLLQRMQRPRRHRLLAFCYTRCCWRSFLSFHKHNSELLALDPVFN